MRAVQMPVLLAGHPKGGFGMSAEQDKEIRRLKAQIVELENTVTILTAQRDEARAMTHYWQCASQTQSGKQHSSGGGH